MKERCWKEDTVKWERAKECKWEGDATLCAFALGALIFYAAVSFVIHLQGGWSHTWDSGLCMCARGRSTCIQRTQLKSRLCILEWKRQGWKRSSGSTTTEKRGGPQRGQEDLRLRKYQQKDNKMKKWGEAEARRWLWQDDKKSVKVKIRLKSGWPRQSRGLPLHIHYLCCLGERTVFTDVNTWEGNK